MSAKDRVLVIDGDGTVYGLRDGVTNRMGHAQAPRASNVEWNETTQTWEIILTDGTYVGEHADRDKAVEMEVAYLNQKILEDPDYVRKSMEKLACSTPSMSTSP